MSSIDDDNKVDDYYWTRTFVSCPYFYFAGAFFIVVVRTVIFHSRTGLRTVVSECAHSARPRGNVD
jgi:hypothetical protein